MLMSKDAIADVVEVLRTADFSTSRHTRRSSTRCCRSTAASRWTPSPGRGSLQRAGDLQRVGGAAYLHADGEGPHLPPTPGLRRDRAGSAILPAWSRGGTRIAQAGYAAQGDVEAIVNRARAEVFDVVNDRTADDYQPPARSHAWCPGELESISRRGGGPVRS